MDEGTPHTLPYQVMDPRRFIGHAVRVHVKRQYLTAIFDQHLHWVFAMTHECHEIAIQLNALHEERCGTPIEILVACCLDSHPAFLLFPKAHLSYDEITELLGMRVAGCQAAAEQMHYLALAMGDATPLSEALSVWVHIDHLLS